MRDTTSTTMAATISKPMADTTSTTTISDSATISMTTTPFLDILPAELRTHIYTHLLTNPLPLKGPTARGESTYSIHTAILRTNKQIYSEARHIFFGRNTFSVSSVPPVIQPHSSTSENGSESDIDIGTGAFEPPLQLKDLHLVRHLSIDLLNHANTDTSAQRYITNISYLLSHLDPSTVKSLTITADTNTPLSSPPSLHPESLDIRTFLLPFHFADLTPRFRAAIANLKCETVAMRFEFADMVFDFEVPRDMAGRGGLVGFAGRVVVKRGEIALRGVLEDLGCEEIEEEGVLEEGSVVCDWVC
jgi:hypothetical protein